MLARPTIDVTSADAYFNSRLRSEKWNEADNDSKAKALEQASFLLTGAFTFKDNSFYLDENDEIQWHERITSAICEQAIYLLSFDPGDIPESLFQGISQASAGSVSATFDKSFVRPWISETARILIGDLAFSALDSQSGTAVSQLIPL